MLLKAGQAGANYDAGSCPYTIGKCPIHADRVANFQVGESEPGGYCGCAGFIEINRLGICIHHQILTDIRLDQSVSFDYGNGDRPTDGING